MELEFYGATGRVTGSCHILRAGGFTVLLDCGLVQGRPEEEALNREQFPFDPAGIDAVVLSHGHIDHSGRLPFLLKQGFRGPVYTQSATLDLCRVLLPDSASLAERDAAYRNRHGKRRGRGFIEPLYTVEDAFRAIDHMRGLRYGEKREILPGISVRLQDAGHILGSALVELFVTEGGVSRKIVYSGDIGQYDTPILNDPATITGADMVIMESTYGDRLHRELDLTLAEIGDLIRSACRDCGNILIPAFSIGRSQELLYLFGKYYEEWELDRWQVYLDSPMAIEASRIYWQYPELYDEDAEQFRKSVSHMPALRNLHLTSSVEQSQSINRMRQGAIIIAGSGMCNGGRIVHHLKHNIRRPECHVVITGFQAEGTLGRKLVEGSREVFIHGEPYAVSARIHTIGGLSAHADQKDLLRWVTGFSDNPVVQVVHGEESVKQVFSALLMERLSLRSSVPAPGERVDLATLDSQPLLERRNL
jgi:metallo-beta-lactamase family protein